MLIQQIDTRVHLFLLDAVSSLESTMAATDSTIFYFRSAILHVITELGGGVGEVWALGSRRDLLLMRNIWVQTTCLLVHLPQQFIFAKIG